MIRLNTQYTSSMFPIILDGALHEPDEEDITGTLYRNGSSTDAIAVTILPVIGKAGWYRAQWTTGTTGWSESDHVEVMVSVVGDFLPDVVYDSWVHNGEVLATPADVDVEVNPTINPTELDQTSIDAIRNGLATSQNVSDAQEAVIEHGDENWVSSSSGGSASEEKQNKILELLRERNDT